MGRTRIHAAPGSHARVPPPRTRAATRATPRLPPGTPRPPRVRRAPARVCRAPSRVRRAAARVRRAARPAAPGYAGLEFRPGIIPLRPLTLGDLYGAVTKAIRGNVAATIGLALVTSLVCLVPTTALGAWVASTGDAVDRERRLRRATG